MSKITEIIDDLRNIENLTEPPQEPLVSGDNIKTINGESVLGMGDLTIEGFTLAQAQATALSF